MKEKPLPRIHKTVVSFNDREMAVIDKFCERYKIKVRSRMYREAIIATILKQLEEDHPRLF
jgi:metal-responsive CopG/Arc/MetJ family transcriptional regulator